MRQAVLHVKGKQTTYKQDKTRAAQRWQDGPKVKEYLKQVGVQSGFYLRDMRDIPN